MIETRFYKWMTSPTSIKYRSITYFDNPNGEMISHNANIFLCEPINLLNHNHLFVYKNVNIPETSVKLEWTFHNIVTYVNVKS